MKFTFDLPDALYLELELKAARENVPINDLFLRFVEIGLYGNEGGEPAESPPDLA